MKRNQRMTKTQLYQLIQETQNNLQNGTPYTVNNNKTNQTVTITLFNANPVLIQYLQMKIESILKKIQTKVKQLSNNNEVTEVPLNSNWNTLSLGTEMYDSLFTFTVDTPQVSYDPDVWNIIYAALPSDYTIPDPEFLNFLRKASENGF